MKIKVKGLDSKKVELEITVETEHDGSFLVSHDGLRIWGAGKTLKKAIGDIQKYVKWLLKNYRTLPGDILPSHSLLTYQATVRKYLGW